MVLWRELPLNLLRDNTEWLRGALHDRLSQVDPSLEFGAVGTTIYPVRYTTLPLPEAEQKGFQLMLSFWAWGDTTEEVMDNLARTLQGLSAALRDAEQAARDIFRGQQRDQDSLRGADLARRRTPAARRP